MLIIKKFTKQCALCPSASIMTLQKGIAISLEGRHLVLTLLASICIVDVDVKKMYITSSSVNTDVLKSSLYHIHNEQLIMEATTKTCSLEMPVHKF